MLGTSSVALLKLGFRSSTNLGPAIVRALSQAGWVKGGLATPGQSIELGVSLGSCGMDEAIVSEPIDSVLYHSVVVQVVRSRQLESVAHS